MMHRSLSLQQLTQAEAVEGSTWEMSRSTDIYDLTTSRPDLAVLDKNKIRNSTQIETKIFSKWR